MKELKTIMNKVMKKINLLAVLIIAVLWVGCSDDFEPLFESSLDQEEMVFSYEGGEQLFQLESNEQWSVEGLTDWVQLTVKDVEATTTRSSYDKGLKEITVVVQPNEKYESRSATILLQSPSKELTFVVTQAKKPELMGYWILSEGYAGQGNAELGWYDVKNDELKTKQFEAINGMKLGDTANELKLYGSKMYCLVSGPGFGTDTPEGEAYVEVLNPQTGESIKRIVFTNKDGVTAKPRNIVFEGSKAYITSYMNEVVRLDTATLTLDAHVSLSGTLAEGLAYHNDKLYICNSGQGEDNKISVVDIESMKEVDIITTAMNPTGIVSVSDNQLFFNTNYPEYELYSLSSDNNAITKIENVRAGDVAFAGDNVYSCFYDWGTYSGASYVYNLSSKTGSELDLDLKGAGIPMIMEYHMSAINGSDDIYLSGMGQDVVIIDGNTQQVKHAFKMGVANGTGVVAVYN